MDKNKENKDPFDEIKKIFEQIHNNIDAVKKSIQKYNNDKH